MLCEPALHLDSTLRVHSLFAVGFESYLLLHCALQRHGAEARRAETYESLTSETHSNEVVVERRC